ncbi:LIM/homeobox protein Awh [Trichostrongylus colubriformis]|uniref:LIM/homeobox protein Awh n=1 Tax=Trichostrongylus colubriformis TaxID=6319 RepID=A0AAN8EU68_TRICO
MEDIYSNKGVPVWSTLIFSLLGTGQQKQKVKRVRTTFAEEQLSVLQAHFQVDSNPDGADLERIASITGLSKRVTQVWFQNSRARQKKFQSNRKSCDVILDNNRSNEGPLSPSQKSEASSDGIFPTSVMTSAEEAMSDSAIVLASQHYE